MKILIRKFKKSDWEDFKKLTKENHEYIVSLDENKLLHVGKNYSNYFSRKYLDDSKKSNGTVAVAIIDKKIVGCGVALTIKSTKEEKEKFRNIKVGRISNLVVSKNYRGKGIGKRIFKYLEKYLKSQNCKFIKLGVFAPNKTARNMYDKLGYTENSVHLIKKI